MKAKPPPALNVRDLRAVASLASEATVEVTSIVEGVHGSIQRSVLGKIQKPDEASTFGLTARIYDVIRGVTKIAGRSADLALASLQRVLDEPTDQAAQSGVQSGQVRYNPAREGLLAALNGVMGDKLARDGNSLATPMSFHAQEGNQAEKPQAKILLVLHGLCMNELQWNSTQDDKHTNHARHLAEQLNYTAVYLRYNSGRHISENGRELSHKLQNLIEAWPVPVSEISVLAHSMGGLVMRSATSIAMQTEAARSPGHWTKVLKNIVFLGTPHHGAPLERAGHWIDLLLGSTPFSAPFLKLTRLRSAGITDLRYGFVSDQDWQSGASRFESKDEHRLDVPLPHAVACFTIAATTAKQRSLLADRLIGDGLVPLYSALGRHALKDRNLNFGQARQKIFYQMNHMQLLSVPRSATPSLTGCAPLEATFMNPLECQSALFNIPPEICYLNAAYMGPLAKPVLAAGHAALEARACPTGITSSDFFTHADRARQRFATLVNCGAEQVAFVSTAAYGVATVAKNVHCRPGQNIVTLAEQFPSNVYPWRGLTPEDIELRMVSRPDGAQRWSDAVLAAIDNNTAVVAIETAHWTDGTLFDVPAIGRAAQAVGAWMVVDGTQTVGAHPIDFKNSNIDALIVHSYKSMLCNYGLGFAVYSDRMKNGRPLEEGWLMRQGSEDFARLVDYQDEYAPGMRRYDTSTRANPGLIMMLDKSCELLSVWQPERIRQYTLSISRDFVKRARASGYQIAEESERAGSIFGIRPPPGTDLAAIRDNLTRQKIYVSVRGSAIRISPHVYNDEADFEKLGQALGL